VQQYAGENEVMGLTYSSVVDAPLGEVFAWHTRPGAITRLMPVQVEREAGSVRPALVPVPGFGPRLLLGAEGVREIAEASQYVRPQRLINAGHHFRYPQLEAALRHMLGREPAVIPAIRSPPTANEGDGPEAGREDSRDRTQDRGHRRRHQRADRGLRPVPD
jgi:hypothetical protein